MTTPLPTLCEIIYDQGDVYSQQEIPFIPYRHRYAQVVNYLMVDIISSFYIFSSLLFYHFTHSKYLSKGNVTYVGIFILLHYSD